MSSNNDGPKKGSDKPAGDTGQAKRPHATLDLKATVVEVKGSGDGDKTTATSAQGKDPGKPDTKTASGPTGPTAGAATSKPAENKPTGAAPAGPAKPAAKPEPVATAKPAGGSAIGRTFTHLVAGGVGGILVRMGFELHHRRWQAQRSCEVEAGSIWFVGDDTDYSCREAGDLRGADERLHVRAAPGNQNGDGRSVGHRYRPRTPANATRSPSRGVNCPIIAGDSPRS